MIKNSPAMAQHRQGVEVPHQTGAPYQEAKLYHRVKLKEKLQQIRDVYFEDVSRIESIVNSTAPPIG